MMRGLPREFDGHDLRIDSVGGMYFITVYDNHSPRRDPFKANGPDEDAVIREILAEMKRRG